MILPVYTGSSRMPSVRASSCTASTIGALGTEYFGCQYPPTERTASGGTVNPNLPTGEVEVEARAQQRLYAIDPAPLKELDRWLEKAMAHAKAKSFDPNVLIHARLAPDQYPLVKQVQAACDAAKFTAAYLSGQKAPSHPDTEQTVEELRARIMRAAAAVLIGLVLGSLMMLILAWLFRRTRPQKVDNGFRVGQLFSAGAYSIGHSNLEFFTNVKAAYFQG